MRIGLWSDAHNFPSLPLMKLSAYHKSLGDQVEMLNHLQHYDRVYASKTFSFTEDVDERCVYVLTNFNSTMAENLYRIYTLRDIGGYRKGFDPYVMIYDKAHAPREIRMLQRWCNNKRIFKTIDRFEDYDAKKG